MKKRGIKWEVVEDATVMETAKLAMDQAEMVHFFPVIARDVTGKESAPYVMGRERTRRVHPSIASIFLKYC